MAQCSDVDMWPVVDHTAADKVDIDQNDSDVFHVTRGDSLVGYC